MLQVSSPMAVLTVAKAILPCTFKKHLELDTVIAYYEGKITGTEAMARINDAVAARNRLGKVRDLRSYPRYPEGKKEIANERGLRSAAVRKLKSPLR